MKLRPEDLTDEMIRGLLDEQASTTPVGPLWSTCVEALGDEWHEDDGWRAIEHNRERASARRVVCEHINARAEGEP